MPRVPWGPEAEAASIIADVCAPVEAAPQVDGLAVLRPKSARLLEHSSLRPCEDFDKTEMSLRPRCG